METHLSISLSQRDNNAKILHITDTHLFANNDALLGVRTNESFQAVIDEIKHQSDDYDLIVATGDFVQDGSRAAYTRFVQTIKQLPTPCVWLPGNHDVYAEMKAVFTQHGLPEKKVILVGEHWLIVLLNSQVVGKPYGYLPPSELEFLAATLANYPDRYVAVFLHHHPIRSNCDWLDQHCLKNSDTLGEIVSQHHNIRSIAWGHIHQAIEKTWYHCHVFSTPSTCVQFKPACHNFTLADDGPGWRVIELSDNGGVKSMSYSLENDSFLPDISQQGY
ncbi:Icc protein [Orbus hercynius]|uniref:Icc protein n=1 Tax=Orbus hercynius TaxID=593135 RepID=A0A495RI74_9GAMM|nr:Icc protein [Orbus hercynius]